METKSSFEKEADLYRLLTDLGTFFATRMVIRLDQFIEELRSLECGRDPWISYNPRKSGYNRWGLSLTSLDGGVSGTPDLDSLREWNRENNQDLGEMSFRTLTEYWHQLPSISNPLASFVPHLGRSHLLKLGECGAFPPHRDLGRSIRLISFLSGDPSSVYLIVDGEKRFFSSGKVYFLDTKKEHAVFSFLQEAYILVLNVELTPDAVRCIYSQLEAI